MTEQRKVYNHPNALKALQYKGMIIRPSNAMVGLTHAKQVGDQNIYVSPAVFELLQDPDVHDLIVTQVKVKEIV